ncbi:serine hydrolase domain-containing protein [Lactobacillus sp. ESL0681]|uniref:serine hydrolase domain-containing protein n=2 Tax=unclassified Lactobacillus TaxID=2620435 RepID=UPI0023F812EE|nr:serine hydrolase domain-containing protein [Lactobacillus sp. ESL0681]WEV41237.1 serine hydrolase [Lactobacillus sp. ESL0681]
MLTALLFGSAASFYRPTTVNAAQTNEQVQTYNFVRNTLKKHHMRGSVAIIKDGQVQTVSYGYAWYGKKLGNGNAKVVYPTASLQKVVTAAMIVQLIDENPELSQYTKISRWYPTLRNSNKISIGNLLTHTSGIKATKTEINRGYNYSEANAINWVVNNINAASSDKVGTYHYNNSNYILLAGIIRQITGQSYEANLKKRIIKPLGLKNTYLYQNIPNRMTDAISYYSNGGKNYQKAGYVKRSLASQIPGAGNLFSTPADYYKIQVGLCDGSILTKKNFNYLTHLNSKVNDYSGGMYLKKNDTLKLAYGSLNNLHFGSWVQLTTDNQNGIVMFLNQTNDNENAEKDVGYDILQYIKPGTFVSR